MSYSFKYPLRIHTCYVVMFQFIHLFTATVASPSGCENQISLQTLLNILIKYVIKILVKLLGASRNATFVKFTKRKQLSRYTRSKCLMEKVQT